MKKLVAVLLLLLVLAGGGVFLYSWTAAGAGAVPAPVVQAAGHSLAPAGYDWTLPVLGGLLEKAVYLSPSKSGEDMGELANGEALALLPPGEYQTTLSLRKDGRQVWSGPPEQWQTPEDAGRYELELLCRREKGQGDAGWGSLCYRLVFSVAATPEPEPEPIAAQAEISLHTGRTLLEQGDILSLELVGVPEGVKPTAETNLGLALFTPWGDGRWTAAIPVGNTREPGDYKVKVAAGDRGWEVPVTVLSYPFDKQNLIIDTTTPEITEANSAEAYQQYREKIPPLFDTYDEARYWDGTFIWPVQGHITTHFGSIRITNGDESTARSHWGMDISNAEGTPVVAPAAGRVVLAEYLLNTGNTVVIEHGGGLKSYYFHMVALTCEADDMVEQGQQIGALGTTGYSTGPHLHFETRIGNQAISPEMLLTEEGGLYSVNKEEPFTPEE